MHIGERVDAEGGMVHRHRAPEKKPTTRPGQPPIRNVINANTAAGASSYLWSHISSGYLVKSPTFTRSAFSCLRAKTQPTWAKRKPVCRGECTSCSVSENK